VPRLLDPSGTLAIILGAQDWSKAGLSNAPSFRRSAAQFHRYLLNPSPRGLELEPDLVLSLFDDPSSAGSQLGRIRDAVRNLVRERAGESRSISDVLIYYVGHGTSDDSGRLHLLVRDSSEGIEAQSSIAAPDLAQVLRVAAPQQRRLVILDCCFSEAAVSAFGAMSGTLDDAVASTALRDLASVPAPERGTLLLCSSPRRRVSIGKPNAERTLFTGALLTVLDGGADHIAGDMLSFYDLRELIYDQMLREHDAPPRPALHQPEQQAGDLTRQPAFPNAASVRRTEDKVRAEGARPAEEEQRKAEEARLAEEQRRLLSDIQARANVGIAYAKTFPIGGTPEQMAQYLETVDSYASSFREFIPIADQLSRQGMPEGAIRLSAVMADLAGARQQWLTLKENVDTHNARLAEVRSLADKAARPADEQRKDDETRLAEEQRKAETARRAEGLMRRLAGNSRSFLQRGLFERIMVWVGLWQKRIAVAGSAIILSALAWVFIPSSQQPNVSFRGPSVNGFPTNGWDSRYLKSFEAGTFVVVSNSKFTKDEVLRVQQKYSSAADFSKCSDGGHWRLLFASGVDGHTADQMIEFLKSAIQILPIKVKITNDSGYWKDGNIVCP
jgi:hypothetical protein